MQIALGAIWSYAPVVYTCENFAHLCLMVWIHIDVNEYNFLNKIQIFYGFFSRPFFSSLFTNFSPVS